jgi:drug/metabolite transporter (DMT)-like permease
LVALLLYLYPALVAVLSASLLHERLSAAKLSALAVALVGTVLTIGPASSASPLGVALGIAAAAIYAVYIIASSRLTARVPPQTMATVVIAAAGAVFLVAALARGPTWPRTPAGWLAVLGIAIISTWRRSYFSSPGSSASGRRARRCCPPSSPCAPYCWRRRSWVKPSRLRSLSEAH